MNKKIVIIGGGNIGMSLARGIADAGLHDKKNIMITRRNKHALEKIKAEGFSISETNAAAVKEAQFVVLAVLPQQLNGLVEELSEHLDEKNQVIISVVSGATTTDILKRSGKELKIVRAMPNTALSVRQSMTCISGTNMTNEELQEVKKLFDSVGTTIEIKEELMTSATALCACGLAFFLRAIRAASQGGVEIGFHAEDAIYIAAQTAKGAAELLLATGNHPENEIDKVTSPQGCTIAGLNEMEHHGFSSSLIKGIKLSADKATKLYKNETI